MVKRNPRVQVTLSPESMRLLDEIAGLMGQPRAALVAELVDASLPALHATVQALRVVKQAPEEAQRLVTAYGTKAIADLAQQQLELDQAVRDARTVKGQRARRRNAPAP